MSRYVISMTSFPPRFNTLAEVLELAVAQDPAPEAVFLNIAFGDLERFMDTVSRPVSGRGSLLRVVPCSDSGPAKKLLPTLKRVSGLPILVIDDDVQYPRDLARRLLDGLAQSPESIIAGRARQVRLSPSGAIDDYRTWRLLAAGEGRSGPDLVPTGMGGILFPPGSLHVDAADEATYLLSAPRADDLWWYIHARRVGTVFRKVALVDYPSQIEGTGEVGLYENGNRSENDAVVARLVRLYGHPLHDDSIWAGPADRLPMSAVHLGRAQLPQVIASGMSEVAPPVAHSASCQVGCAADLEAMRALEVRFERTLAALQQESALVDGATRELEDLKTRFLEVSQAHELHRQMLTSVFESRSWKFTRPLRRERRGEAVHE